MKVPNSYVVKETDRNSSKYLQDGEKIIVRKVC